MTNKKLLFSVSQGTIQIHGLFRQTCHGGVVGFNVNNNLDFSIKLSPSNTSVTFEYIKIEIYSKGNRNISIRRIVPPPYTPNTY